jgi:hypothetical protein
MPRDQWFLIHVAANCDMPDDSKTGTYAQPINSGLLLGPQRGVSRLHLGFHGYTLREFTLHKARAPPA